MIACDESKSRFEEFIKNYEYLKVQDISESDTRSKLIDRMLIDVLGWDESDISREGHVDSGYFDYKVSIAGLTLIIEAKRHFVDFIFPNEKKRKCKLGTLYKDNKEVIDQIRTYISDCGCDTGIITNGKQYLISKFINTNGTSWKDNKCILYRDFQEIEDNFIEFWNTLSKESIIQNRGIKQLYDTDVSFYKTILSSISDKDNEIVRNDLSAKIASLIDKALGDIYNANDDEDDMEFIKECYVENKEVIKNKCELNSLFSDNPPALKEVSKARNIDSLGKQIHNEISKYPAERYRTQKPGIPVPLPYGIGRKLADCKGEQLQQHGDYRADNRRCCRRGYGQMRQGNGPRIPRRPHHRPSCAPRQPRGIQIQQAAHSRLRLQFQRAKDLVPLHTAQAGCRGRELR